MTIGSRAKACKRQTARVGAWRRKGRSSVAARAVSSSDGARSIEYKEEIASRASTPLSGNRRKPLKKQRADRLSGAWRRQRGNPLYLAVLIGGMSLIFFAIVVSPLGLSTPLFWSRQEPVPQAMRSLARRAVLRAQRRGGMAAVVQRSNRRGACFHRSDGASSQAVERGPTPQGVRPQAR